MKIRKLALALPLALAAAGFGREKVLFDTDIGGDPDDGLALVYLLREPRCDLLGVTTVGDCPDVSARVASALCRSLGRSDVPIHAGCSLPIHRGRGPSGDAARAPSPWEKGWREALARWPHDAVANDRSAVAFLRAAIRANPGEVTLCATGPLSNVATLFALDPEIPSLLKRFVFMGGDFRPGRGEWNASVDVFATAAVLEGGYRAPPKELVLIGAETTSPWNLPPDAGRAFLAQSPDLAFVGGHYAEQWFARPFNLFFHDPAAAVAIFHPEIFTFAPSAVRVDVADRAVTTRTAAKGDATWVWKTATALDVEAFKARFLGVLKARVPEMGTRAAAVPPLSGDAPPPPSPLFLEPKDGTNLLFNASFEMGKDGHQVAFEVPCGRAGARGVAQVVEGDAVHGRRFLRIDTRAAGCRAVYLSNAPRLRCGTNVVYSVWLRADAPGRTASVELGGRSFNFHAPKPLPWRGAARTFDLKEVWTRHEVYFAVPDEQPFALPRLVFPQPGVYCLDAEQLEIGDAATPFAPAAAVEGAYRLRETVFAQADTEETRRHPPVRQAALVRHDYRTGETSERRVAFETPRYGCFSLSGTLEGRPVLPAEYAVVHALGAHPGAGLFVGLNGGLGGLRPWWETRAWYDTEENAPSDYYRLLRLSGARMLRLWDGNLDWMELEPEKGAYDWAPLDFVVDHARANGMEPMYVLGGTAFLKWKDAWKDRIYTNWFVRLNARPARKTGMPTWTEALELRDADWTDFARDAVRRYRGRIRYWETVNEPNLQVADVDYYVRLMKLAYETVKREDPAATVVGICSTGDFGGDLGGYIGAVGEKGGFRYLDWMSFHPYSGPTDVTPKTAETQLGEVRRLVEKYRPGCPVLEDELYFICDNGAEKMENRAQNWRASNLARRFVLDFAGGCVGSTPLHEGQIWGAGPEIAGITANLGFFRHRLYANARFVVGNAFAHFLEGGRFLRVPKLPAGVNGGVFRDRAGREVTVLWAKRAADARDWPVPADCTAYDHFGNRLAGEAARLTEDAVYLVQDRKPGSM